MYNFVRGSFLWLWITMILINSAFVFSIYRSESVLDFDDFKFNPRTKVEEKRALFVSIPFHGHIRPMATIAKELNVRGWEISFATTLEGKRSVVQSGLDFVSLGSCDSEEHMKRILASASDLSDFIESSEVLMAYTYGLWECMFVALRAHVEKLEAKPSVIVVDWVTLAGFDVGDLYQIPVVVNDGCLLFTISETSLPPADDIPTPYSEVSIHNIGSAFLQRVFLPPLRIVIRFLLKFRYSAILKYDRVKYGLMPFEMIYATQKRLVLSNTAFGLEYPRALPPSVQLAGPMLMSEATETKLDEVELNWIESDQRPVVFFSMGTIARLSHSQIQSIIQRFNFSKYRVLMKLKDTEKVSLEKSTDIMVVEWVSSQTRVLEHPKVELFITHCGIISVFESMNALVPVVCIPLFADQLDMGMRVQDMGIGKVVKKEEITESDALSEAIHNLINNRSLVIKNIEATKDLMFLTGGGAPKAADWIEYVAKYGFKGLLQPKTNYMVFQEYNMDVFLLWILLLTLLLTILNKVTKLLK